MAGRRGRRTCLAIPRKEPDAEAFTFDGTPAIGYSGFSDIFIAPEPTSGQAVAVTATGPDGAVRFPQGRSEPCGSAPLRAAPLKLRVRSARRQILEDVVGGLEGQCREGQRGIARGNGREDATADQVEVRVVP